MSAAAELVPGLCRYLDGAVTGLTFDELGTSGNVFDGDLPQTPDEVVGLREYAGVEPDSLQGYDEVYVQIRVRGPIGDPRPPRTRVHAIRDALDGLTNRALPSGPFVVLVHALQPPFPMDGKDGSGRYEYVLNVSVEVRNPSGLRV